MLVEPKVNAPFDGKVSVDILHEEAVITIVGKNETKTYNFRKSDIAKPTELAGISGKIEGKIYLPYTVESDVKAHDSIVEVIKDGWNVPSRIPYASEILVENGAPVTQKIFAKEQSEFKH